MLGKPVPDFSLPSTGGGTFRLAGQRGTRLALYFYPKDDIPGCTREASHFRDFHHSQKKDNLLYGRKVRGIERSTPLIDEKGRLAREWRGVKVPGHVEEVLNFAKAL